MNDVLRKIYELYFEDEYYMEQLLNDKDYTKISKKLNQQEKELSLLYKTKCNENIDKILNDFLTLICPYPIHIVIMILLMVLL